LPLVGNPEVQLKQLEAGKADAERRKEEKALKAEAQKLQKAAAAQAAKEQKALATRPAAVKAEAEAKSDERLAVFMKWVESKLVELTNSAKVAGRPAKESEEIVRLIGEALKAQLQTDYFDPVSTAVNNIIDAFVELQERVAQLSSSVCHGHDFCGIRRAVERSQYTGQKAGRRGGEIGGPHGKAAGRGYSHLADTHSEVRKFTSAPL
jgi:hypothetical protein